MKMQTRTKEQFTNELEKMRQRVAELEQVDAERKRAEEELRESEEKYRLLIDNLIEPLTVYDSNGHILLINVTSAKNLGSMPEDVVGKSLYDFFPDTADAYIERARRIYESGVGLEFEHEVSLASGKRWFYSNIQPVKDTSGKVISVQNISYDVTERKRAEDALRESEEKLRLMFESITDVIVVTDLQGKIIEVNKAAVQLAGMSREEIINKDGLTLLKRKEHKEFIELGKQVLQGDAPVASTEREMSPMVGSAYDADLSLGTLHDSAGNPTGFVAVVHDITERKRAEQERERLLAELEDKSKEMKQLLFVASHDLRSPLVNIQGFTREIEHSLQQVHSVLEEEDIPSAVKEKLAAPIKEGIADSLSYILASSSKIDTLLTGLLKLSRLGRVAITIEKLNMSDLMAEVVDGFEFQTKEAGVKLKVGKLPPCQSDKAQINQVFSNLISNALKYLDPERPGIIRISGIEEDSNVIYTVEDNGIGIAPENQETVFEIFQRVGSSASSGEGLGLTIVRRILDRHGGKVWLESEPGRGSRFHVSLPTGD